MALTTSEVNRGADFRGVVRGGVLVMCDLSLVSCSIHPRYRRDPRFDARHDRRAQHGPIYTNCESAEKPDGKMAAAGYFAEERTAWAVMAALILKSDPFCRPSGLTFDQYHAIVSYPLAVLRITGDSAKANGGATVNADEMDFLVKKCRARKAVLAPLLAFIRGTLAT